MSRQGLRLDLGVSLALVLRRHLQVIDHDELNWHLPTLPGGPNRRPFLNLGNSFDILLPNLRVPDLSNFLIS